MKDGGRRGSRRPVRRILTDVMCTRRSIWRRLSGRVTWHPKGGHSILPVTVASRPSDRSSGNLIGASVDPSRSMPCPDEGINNEALSTRRRSTVGRGRRLRGNAGLMKFYECACVTSRVARACARTRAARSDGRDAGWHRGSSAAAEERASAGTWQQDDDRSCSAESTRCQVTNSSTITAARFFQYRQPSSVSSAWLGIFFVTRNFNLREIVSSNRENCLLTYLRTYLLEFHVCRLYLKDDSSSRRLYA